MRLKHIFLTLCVILFGYLSTHLTSCKKDLLLSEEALTFSLDTVVFDTVFTTVGSSTRKFKIYNPSNRPVQISSINLEGGTDSPFRFNLDGVSGVNFKDVEIPGNDSLFAFVEVTLGENNQSNPLIIEDKVSFVTNGKEQEVKLVAWGQDAYFHYRDTNSNSDPWLNDKPHVIYDYALVDSATTLDIQAGTKIHLHKNSLLYVYKGTLNINGTANDKVIIQGDRLEPFYEDVKGQYYGVYFQEARSSTIDHAIIKNGTSGIHVFSEDENNFNPTLTITNTEIFNHSNYGIWNYSGGRIVGENLNIYNIAQHAYFLLEGGSHDFRHCQFLGYGTDENSPAIAIKNYFTRADGITYIGDVQIGNIYNSIIDGSGENQVAYDTITDNGAVTIAYEYGNNLIKLEDELSGNTGFNNNIWNTNPGFENVEESIFKITSSSVLKDAGNDSFTTLPNDIEGNPRGANPDIGAYEVD
ncbi:MAG: right-handed parallel beta-helix repeat-containing protein [Brumimicrobium sp.]